MHTRLAATTARRTALPMLLAFLVASATSPDAMAQQPHFAQNSPERFAFDIADVDGDGRISEA
ncbi:MAG TPA: hypothetical protein VFO41_05615, partial [Alphaproteobacteria bacterium]|nr:hypothetical protein [Alphaproteobacteria bacterium]